MIFRRIIPIFLTVFMEIAPYSALEYVMSLDELKNKVLKMLKQTSFSMVFDAVFIAPIFEEPIFRLHLDLTKKSILWSLGVSIFLIFDFGLLLQLFGSI